MNSSQDNVVPIRKAESKKDGRGEFFAIDSSAWSKVCNLGIGAAVAYLVLANGTGGDHRTTSWSAKSMEKYLRMHNRLATKMIQLLIEKGFVRQDKSGARPRYYILPMKDAKGADIEPDWIWMPNSIIESIKGVSTPIGGIYLASDLGALKLCVELYHAQDLAQPFDAHNSRLI